MQRDRRRDPYPWTWEIPLGIGIGVLLVATVGVQLGRSAANLAAGAGWTWPATDTGPFPSPLGSAFWSSLPGVLAGHADAGLVPSPAAGELASAPLLWGCLALTQLLLLTGCGCLGARAYQRWGPGRMKGMATAAEAESMLGVTRLRKVAKIVRPDLHGRSPATSPQAVEPTAGRSRSAETDVGLGQGLSPWLLPGRRSRKEVQR